MQKTRINLFNYYSLNTGTNNRVNTGKLEWVDNFITNLQLYIFFFFKAKVIINRIWNIVILSNYLKNYFLNS